MDFSKTLIRGTVCGKTARTDLWGSGEVTNRSTRSKENDNEVFGAEGTFQDYGMRSYDPRVCRFFSVDPIGAKFPWYTPYQFAGNNPIKYIDLDDLEKLLVVSLEHSHRTQSRQYIANVDGVKDGVATALVRANGNIDIYVTGEDLIMVHIVNNNTFLEPNPE